MTPDGRGDVGSGFESEGIEIRRTVEIDVSDFILNFGLNFVESDLGIECAENSLDLPHILLYYYIAKLISNWTILWGRCTQKVINLSDAKYWDRMIVLQ